MEDSVCFNAFLEDLDDLDGINNNSSANVEALIFSTCGEPEIEPMFDKRRWRFWITGVMTVLTSFIGLIGNFLSIITLLDKSLNNVFNHLMIFLCIADMLVILGAMAMSLKNLHPSLSTLMDPLITSFDCISHVSTTASVFLTISITLERYSAVCSPLTYQARVVSRGQTIILCSYLVPAVIMSIILNTPKILSIVNLLFAEFTFNIKENLYGKEEIKLNIVYQVIHPLLTCCVFPLVSLTVLNVKIVKGSQCIRNSRLKPELSLYHVMMMVVGVFILFSLPRTVMALYEVSTINNIITCLERNCRYSIGSGQWVADSIIRYLLVLNSSTNFIIYCFYGSIFRQVLKDNLSKIFCSERETTV